MLANCKMKQISLIGRSDDMHTITWRFPPAFKSILLLRESWEDVKGFSKSKWIHLQLPIKCHSDYFKKLCCQNAFYLEAPVTCLQLGIMVYRQSSIMICLVVKHQLHLYGGNIIMGLATVILFTFSFSLKGQEAIRDYGLLLEFWCGLLSGLAPVVFVRWKQLLQSYTLSFFFLFLFL